MDASLGISRRTLLRRGAAVGGLVWTAPVVHTLAAPAASAGTPVDGLSYVAVVLRGPDGLHYKMKWEVEGGLKGPESGEFSTPGRQLSYPDIQDGPASGAAASLSGNGLTITADPGFVLVDYAIKHGPCAVGPGQSDQPSTGTSGPWTFNPLASPPVC